MASTSNSREETLKWNVSETIWQQSLSLSNKEAVTVINDGKFALMGGKIGAPTETALDNLISMATHAPLGVLFILLVVDSGDLDEVAGMRGYQFIQRSLEADSLKNVPFFIVSGKFSSYVLVKERSVAPRIMIIDGPRKFSRALALELTKTAQVETISDSSQALEQLRKCAAAELKKITLVVMDIGHGTGFLDTMKQIIPEAAIVVTVPVEMKDLALTEEVINAGAVMVAQKLLHKLLLPFIKALM